MTNPLYNLIAIFTIIQTQAATLSAENWWTEAPEGCFTFKEDGTLHISSYSNGNELFYIIKDEDKGTNLMQNGSGLSISIQLNTATFLNDKETSLHINFHNNNSEINGADYYQYIHIDNINNSLNIYDRDTKMDFYHTLDLDNEITTVLVNFTVKNDMLYCNYSVNSYTSNDFIIKEAPTQLDWKPSFGLSATETNIFTVTDVSFISVPEPTTASLTLLALTGYTLRRRRVNKSN